MPRPKKNERRVVCTDHCFQLKARDEKCYYQNLVQVKICSNSNTGIN